MLIVLTSLVLILNRTLLRVRSQGFGKLSNPPSLPQLDPLTGLDTVFSSYRKLRCHQFLSLCQQRFAQVGNTYAARIPGSRIIVTCEPENVKALLATQHQDFWLGQRRKQAFHPLLGDSIFASDGQLWKEARQQLRPSFTKDRLSDASIFEAHVNALIKAVNAQQTNSEAVDLQELFFRLSLDIATHFFFGESCCSLSAESGQRQAADFADAFNRSQQTLVDDFVLGSFARCVPHLQFWKDRRTVQKFAESYVRIAIDARHHQKPNNSKKCQLSVLEELARQSDNVHRLRDQALSLLVAGRDTTASLLSNLWFVVARRPDIWDKLKGEIEFLNGRGPQMDELKDLKYLQACMRECKRRLSYYECHRINTKPTYSTSFASTCSCKHQASSSQYLSTQRRGFGW